MTSSVDIVCRKSQGFTLVELMISVTLGMVLIGSLFQVISNHKMLTNTEMSLTRVQESGRYVMDMFTREIRKVGYHGCTDPSEMSVNVMSLSGVDSDFGGTSLRGFEVGAGGVFSPALSASDALNTIEGSSAGNARVGSDVLQIKYAQRTGAKLVSSTDASSAFVTVDSNSKKLEINDIAMIANCQSAHIFTITDVTKNTDDFTFSHSNAANSTTSMTPGYADGADILAYKDLTFFIADTNRVTNDGMTVYSLFRKDSTEAVAQELIEGVEFMQVLYGQNLGAGQMRFVSAGTAGLDMQDVVAIRVAILLQGFEISMPEVDDHSYTLLDQVVSDTGDIKHNGGRYLRKVFASTVQLRNTRSSNN